jgi:phenylacetate-CoA ligase
MVKETYEPVLDHGESLSREDLSREQLERLKTSIANIYADCAPYRKKCDEAGVRPDDLQTLTDLAKFPFTTKADLRAAYPFGFFSKPMDEIVRVHASSGTTGQPTVVGYTKNDIETWASVVARSIRAAGGRPGMKIHVAYGYGLFTGGLGAHYGAEALGCTVIPMSGGQTEKQVRLIQDFEPDIIMVTPSYMLAILDEFKRQGLNPRDSSLKIGIFGAEPWGDGMRAEIEQAFDIDAVDIYGLSEVIGPGVANECVETKDGLTIWEDHFYPEIINPETGEVLPDGELGELVFTSLTKEAMPIIRYRTRDLTRLLPGTARTMRRMDRISGRSDDMLIIRGVNVFPTQIEEILMSIGALSPHYQIEINRPDRMDEVTIRVEGRSESGEGDRSASGQELASRIKTNVGISTRIEIVDPNTLARSQGKAQRVIDNRPS